jgi:hypothetical protein
MEIPGTSDTSLPASHYLLNNNWLKSVYTNLSGYCNGSGNVFSTSDAELANKLALLLNQRLRVHISKRAPGKENHWVWRWVNLNIAPMAALVVSFGLTKKNIACASEGSSLLTSNPCAYVSASGLLGKHEGAYLYFNSDENLAIRSGKVVGQTRNFETRHMEHLGAAKLVTSQSRGSKFYICYPSHDAKDISREVQRGFFEDLALCVGIGFSRTNTDAISALCSSDTPESILMWNKFTRDKVKAIKFPGCSSVYDKQLHMAGYLFELILDLMISPSANVSESPGFESCLGIFGAGM